MGIARERVVPALGPRAWVGFAGLGCAVGVVQGAVLPQLERFVYETALVKGLWGWGPNVADALAVLPFLIGPVLVLLRVTQRWSCVFAFGLAGVIAMGVIALGYDCLSRADGGASVGAWAGTVAVRFIVPPVQIMALIAATRLLVRWLVVRTTEVGAHVCHWCGYVRGPGVGRCPECGREAARARIRLAWLVGAVLWAARRGWVLALIAVVAACGLAVRPLVVKTLPSVAFYSRFAGWTRAPEWSYMSMGSAVGAGGAYGAPCVWRGEGGDPKAARGVYVFFVPAAGADERMIVGVSGDPKSGMSMGSIRVGADLDDRQAAWVLEHGVPEALVRKLYEVADAKVWMPASAPRGEVRVDAGEFFSKDSERAR